MTLLAATILAASSYGQTNNDRCYICLTRPQSIAAADSALKGQHAVKMLAMTENLLASKSSDVADLKKIVAIQGKQMDALHRTIAIQGDMMDFLKKNRTALRRRSTANLVLSVAAASMIGYAIGAW